MSLNPEVCDFSRKLKMNHDSDSMHFQILLFGNFLSAAVLNHQQLCRIPCRLVCRYALSPKVADRTFNLFVLSLMLFEAKESFVVLQEVHRISVIPVLKPLLVIFCLQKRFLLTVNRTYL